MTLASSTDYGKDENAADKLLAKNKVLETDIQTYQTIVNGVGKESQRLFKTGCQDPQSLRKAQVNKHVSVFISPLMGVLTLVAPASVNAPVSVNVDNNGRYRSCYCKQDHVNTKRR